jgi:phosphohistidine phosphatase
MMNVYLVRHAEAEKETVDPSRGLTKRGRRDTRRVAALAAKLGLEVQQIRHSGKTRAEQTAAILGEGLSPPGGVEAVSGLAPMDDVRPVADELSRVSQPVMLVGHLPFMERLAGQLLVGDANRPIVRFRTAAIACLVREGEREQGIRWQVAWMLTPEMG